MKQINHILLILPVIVLAAVSLLVACSQGSQAGAADAVTAYFQALVEKDLNQLISVSCAAWESDARQELRTFDAVDVTLENIACQTGGGTGAPALVNCTGKIVANYGNEVLEINLADRQYLAANEGGEWRMCGYR